MSKLQMLQGLPGSGKSTYAKEQVAKGGWVRVNNDDLRETLHNGKWSRKNEDLIDRARDFLIQQCLMRGDSVLVDNLNLHPKHEQYLKEIAKKHGAVFEKKFFDVSVEECIKRDLNRPKSVGEKVIRQWHRDYLAPKPEIYKWPKGKPKACIFDCDGTLSHVITDRDIYDGSRAGEDALDEVVGRILRTYHDLNHKIIIMTGRSAEHKAVTEKWLTAKGIPYDALFTRKTDDKRPDEIIKKELFYEHVKDNYQIEFIVDDRLKVCRMWHNLGLKLLRVGDPDADF